MCRYGFGILALLLATSFTFAGTSNSLMDVAASGKSLIVANTDSGTVTLVDLEKREVVREINVGKKPEGVAWIGNGPLAAATLYHSKQVVIFNTDTGKIEKTIDTAAEPYGIVTDTVGKRAWVSHEYPGLVSEIDLDAGKVMREIPAGAMPRGIALAPDGKRVYVTEFYTGILNAIDVDSGKIVDSWKGHSTDNLCRHVTLHPTRPKAYLSHIRSMIKVNDGSGSIFPQVSVRDLKPSDGQRGVSFGMDTFNGVYVVTNPWESAISPDGKRFYVIYAGTNDMNYCNVIDDDYKEIERAGYPARTGQNPRAIRVSPDGNNVYIYNAMDFSIGVYTAKMSLVKTIKTCEPAKTPEWVRGKVLFNTANPPMTTRKWIACSSCHPDGLHDARVWQQGEGLRKTTAFVGMAHTHPLHWSADRDEVQDFEYTIRSKLMQGRGLISGSMKPKIGFHKAELEERTSGRSKDLDAMAVYCNSLEFPLSPHIAAPGKLTPAAERGKAVFFQKEVGCATCHTGPYYTDSSLQKPFKLHDVGTGRADKSERMGSHTVTDKALASMRAQGLPGEVLAKLDALKDKKFGTYDYFIGRLRTLLTGAELARFQDPIIQHTMERRYDTPTLLGIYRTAPYLHDGSAATLRDVVTTQNKGDEHGKTSQLAKNEVDDLVEFLKALPYEMPPDVTPNTVEFRLKK